MGGKPTIRLAIAPRHVPRFREKATSPTWTRRVFLLETFLKLPKVEFHHTPVFFRATFLRLKTVDRTLVLLGRILIKKKIFTPQCDAFTVGRPTLVTPLWGFARTIAL